MTAAPPTNKTHKVCRQSCGTSGVQLCHLSSHHPQSFLISVPISAPPARPGASPGRERPRCSPEQQSPVGLAVDTLLSWGATLLLSWVPTSHTPCLGTPSTCSHPGYPLYMLPCLVPAACTHPGLLRLQQGQCHRALLHRSCSRSRKANPITPPCTGASPSSQVRSPRGPTTLLEQLGLDCIMLRGEQPG